VHPVSARFATVGFLFQRKGCVRVALNKDAKVENGMDSLIETALEAGADDFREPDEASEDTIEMQVRYRDALF
jgi:translational activator of cytochrome c oxidase 1